MPKKPTLTNKQRAFIEQYLIDFNATQAAIRAGYSAKTAGSIGQENLTKPDIKSAIQARLSELQMTADEALLILKEHARGSLDDFIDEETGAIDLAKARKLGKMHLLKEYTVTTVGPMMIKTRIKLHDPQAAAVWIGKHHGAFLERVDHTSAGKELTALTADRLAAADKQAEEELKDWEGDRLGSDSTAD